MTPERWQNLTQVTNNPATDSQASWLPGVDKLVFLSNRDSDYLKLWTVSLTSGKEEPLLDLGAGWNTRWCLLTVTKSPTTSFKRES